MPNRSQVISSEIAFSEQTEHELRRLESDEVAELGRLGLRTDSARLRTSQAFRMAEWDYVTDADLETARYVYGERLAAVRADVETGILKGAQARRAVRFAEHALTVAERQTTVATYREDDTDFDPLLADVIAAREYVRPTSDQVIIASRNPMGIASWSLALEHAATQFLHAHGVRTTQRPDVWSRRHNTHLAMADRVAYKGAIRYAPPTPCRVGKLGDEPAELGNVETRVTELLVTPRYVVVDGVVTPNNGRVRVAWRGHRKITVRLAERQRASAVKRGVKRANLVENLKVGKRGPAVDPWNLSARSIPAKLKANEVAAWQALKLESILRTSQFGATLTMSDGTTVSLTDVSLSTATYRDVAYPVRELSRRAALAGLDLAD